MRGPAWSAGYVSDVAYTLGFHAEMAPAHIDYALTLNGIAGPGQGAVSYCELGCGRGFGTALLAAANPDSRFVGVDFNPAHIQEARALADRAELTNVRFVEASFAEAARGETEPFDIVALHGVYSWVSAAVRATTSTNSCGACCAPAAWPSSAIIAIRVGQAWRRCSI